MRKESMRFKRMWVHKHFFQSKMVLDIPKEEEKKEDLEKEADDKSKVKCCNYQQTGHHARDCWSPTKRVEENANLMIEEEKEITLLVHNKRMQDKENMWYLDNEASNHMCGDKNKFIELDETIRGNVTFADHSKVSIKGKGTILIKLKDESYQLIGDVYYIPIVKSKILSLR
jgi:hypothetical protein